MADREFDIVLFGAAGFVGALTARYLAEHAPTDIRIALAGRSRDKLETVRSELPITARDWPLVIADATSPASLDAMVNRTRVVCTTVGPYLRYGEGLLSAAATAGTDYVDLTGEVPFVRRSIDKYHDIAVGSGARIVHSCGFDSVPSDLGVYLLHRTIADTSGAGTMMRTTMVVTTMRGGISGGTIDSARVLAEQAGDPDVRRMLLNPHALSGGPNVQPARRPEWGDMSVVKASAVDPALRGMLAPFFMGSYNTRIVRRSNVLLDNAYGPGFCYSEAMAVGRNRVLSAAVASVIAAGSGLFLGAMVVGPTRSVFNRILPKPGQGPSQRVRDRGHFTTRTFTTTTTGKRFRATIRAQGDPGYKATALMLGESALTLVMARDELPARTGVLTPAAAMGDMLIERLRTAGMTLECEELA